MNKTIHRMLSMVLACAMMVGSYISAQAASERSPENVAGVAYYVSTTGNDSNPGTSSAPFKTFAKAASMLGAGGTLYINAGTYNEQLKVSTSGADGAWITIKPVSGAVVIDLMNTASPVVVLQGSYIAIENMEIKGSSDTCVRLAGNNLRASNLTVHNCRTHGILASGKNIEIAGNTVYGTSMVNQARSGTVGWGSGIKVEIGGQNVLIHDNVVYHNYGEGIASTRGSIVTIRNNNVYDNFSVNLYVDNSIYVWVEKNLVTCHANSGFERNGSPAAGIALGEEFYDGWGAQLDHVTVANNIVAYCKQGVYYYGAETSISGGGLKNSTIAYNTIWSTTDTALGVMYASGQVGTLIANNIIWQANNKLAYVQNAAGLTFQNNLWKVAPPANAKGTGDKIGDPAFVTTPGYTADTFTLSGLSPAITGASNIGITVDYANAQRGPTFDMGALQYFGIVPAAASPTATLATLTPTTAWTPTQIPTYTATVPAPTITNTLVPTQVEATPTQPSIDPTATTIVEASPTATSLPTATIPPILQASPQAVVKATYDDKDPSLVYSSDWQNTSNRKAFRKSFKTTATSGSYMTFSFTGSTFTILHTKGPGFGTVDVYVDNVFVGTINEKASSLRYQRQWVYPGTLPVGLHELKLVFTGSKTKGNVDAIIVH